MLKPIILCGGKGTRLWPLSRELFPKQFSPVCSGQSLLQATLMRLSSLRDTLLPPLAICNVAHRFLVAEQFCEMDIQGEIVLEPMPRDTAPAIAVSALLSLEEDPLLLVMPADHVITDCQVLAEAVAKATILADKGHLVTFGVTPQKVHTGFGYIRCGEALETGFHVDEFVEKPDYETAVTYFDSKDYYWNSGIFLFRASTFVNELERLAPDILEACRGAIDARKMDLGFLCLDKEAFSQSPAISVDYAVMEKTDRCAMVVLEDQWNDLGSWNAIYDMGEKDECGNVCRGDVLSLDSSNCLLQASDKLLATLGVENIVAIETSDAVLIAHRDRVQDVKKMVERLREQGREEGIHHRKVYRPWGAYESMDQGYRFQVKRITVKPGQILSLQMHHHRAEHWIVVRGTAKVVNGDKEIILSEDQSTYIPLGHVHRLENPGKIPLELIEVQTGSYLGEDDIVRISDEYGRALDDTE